MKNDEKIDINLANDAVEDLSEEELAQQNYNTALRYINIAEHMKQFEDQDKYYHRAIRYLKLSRPYIKVNPLIRELRKKKFAARAEGKINLYQEACKIRDKATTPNDYYSAQTLFHRIHTYELTHTIPENRVPPDVYEKVCKCADSEQQAILCGELAAKKSAEIKKRSLLMSIIFIAAIAAVLFFTRTTAFRQCLASYYSITRNYDGAWRAYSYIYDHKNDSESLENYKLYRYKTAVKALNKGDTNTAYSNFKALAKENYKDSLKQFILLEQYRIANTELGSVVSFGNMDWRVLEKQEDKVLLLKDHAFGSTAFHEKNTDCTWETSSVRKWLNHTFLERDFYNEESALILDTNVSSEDNPTYGTSGGKNTTDKVFLLSTGEVTKYYDYIHKTKTCWWLRTPGAVRGSMCFVYRDKTIMDYGYDVSNTNITVKPAIWVSIK